MSLFSEKTEPAPVAGGRWVTLVGTEYRIRKERHLFVLNQIGFKGGTISVYSNCEIIKILGNLN